VIGRAFDLADIVEARRYLDSNARLGEIVVTARR